MRSLRMPIPSRDMDQSDTPSLVKAASDGDQKAWNTIVDRYANLVWSIARGFRLSSTDAADVSQATWLRLVEHLHQLREPAAIGSWLATTARREALSLLRRRHEVPTADFEPLDATSDEPAPWHRLVVQERDTELWNAFRQLSRRCQELLRLLVIEEATGYAAAAAALSVPTGSLGPTRGRCLVALRANLGRSAGDRRAVVDRRSETDQRARGDRSFDADEEAGP